METTRLWAHVAAGVRPEWIEAAAPHLVMRSYSEPHWDPDRGAATGFERVTLFGLTLVEGRRVDWARVDPAGARELFIRHALVQGEWRTHQGFVARNRRLVDKVLALEDRVRRRGLLVDDEVLERFFDERVPDHVVSTRHFERWWRGVRDDDPYLLDYTARLLVDPSAGPVEPDAFPDTWSTPIGDLALHYVFDPTVADDGVTVEVPLAALPALDPAPFAWQVPGHRVELVAALLRTLPKETRRQLGPPTEVARRLLDRAGPDDGALLETLSRLLAGSDGAAIPEGDWHPEHLPAHLSINVRVVDGRGRVVAEGRDLEQVRRRLRPRLRVGIAAASPSRSGRA